MYSLEMGAILGEHIGAHFYTIGQRKGLRIGGKSEPLFVLQTNVASNTIFVGMGENHPGLSRRCLFITEEEAHWVRGDLKLELEQSSEYLSRIRYRQALQKAKLTRKKEGYYLLFESAQKAIAAGQFAAWYKDEELIGSGVIYA